MFRNHRMAMETATCILGIETSCDETAAALVRRNSDGSGEILSDIVFSQLDEHAAYGGVVPEIAARAHVERLDGLIARALDEAGAGLGDIDAVAATSGPGLIGGLIVKVGSKMIDTSIRAKLANLQNAMKEVG